MFKTIVVLILLVPATLAAGKVISFGHQEIEKKEAAKLTLLKSKGSRGVDHLIYSFICEIDSIDLIDYFKVSDDLLPVKERGLARDMGHFSQCLSIGWPFYPEKEVWLIPGNHRLGVFNVARLGADFQHHIDYPLSLANISFDALAGHEYELNPDYDGNCWRLAVKDKSLDSLVAKLQLEWPGKCKPDSIDSKK